MNISSVHSMFIDYNDAFDQRDIHQNFNRLLPATERKETIYSHTPKNSIVIILNEKYDKSDENRDTLITSLNNRPEILCKFQENCLSQLNHARRKALLRPIHIDLMTVGFTGAVTALGWYLCPESLSKSVIAGSLLGNVRNVYELSQNIYSLYFPPYNPISELEEKFALNQCFVPKILWDPIIAAFAIRRWFTLKEKDRMNFAIDLTVYRSRENPPITPLSNKNYRKLDTKMNTFFETNHMIDEKQCSKIKCEVFRFVFDNDKKFEYPFYIYGLEREQKESLVNTLYEWLTDGNTDSILLERFAITSPGELKGSKKKPGVFLQVLSNQCLKKKNTSLVILEGTDTDWLNREDMCSPARRAFEYDTSKGWLSCEYLEAFPFQGRLHLDTPSMFVIAFGDKQLKDKGLAARLNSSL